MRETCYSWTFPHGGTDTRLVGVSRQVSRQPDRQAGKQVARQHVRSGPLIAACILPALATLVCISRKSPTCVSGDAHIVDEGTGGLQGEMMVGETAGNTY